MKQGNISEPVANVLKLATDGKVVLVGRRQSNVFTVNDLYFRNQNYNRKNLE